MRLLFVLLLLLITTPCLAAPHIVVSIAPLHSLVSALTSGISEPQLLLTRGGSPHSASLRPSQARALSEADLLIWVGPELESFLSQPISRLVKPQAEMQLLALDGLELLTQRQGGFWEDDEEPEAARHTNNEQRINPHIWLSPDNARQISALVSARLIRIDPQNSTSYQQNLARLEQRIVALQTDLTQRLQPLQESPYLVFHDAYPYFEKAFSLNAIGSIRISAERPPGARRLQQIRSKISETAALCLFSEPQFSPALAQRLADDTGLKLGVLDPLGSAADIGEDAWFILMEKLAKNLEDCLGDPN